ncbi:MAG: hypothetical protein BGO14_10895 [Chlamydiales bacterium 38-26]|nr:hypothetical protein [Chlamydiales bacterium]OJV11459.1 MAG: hypothetical protein BGO14_10895 [Chlamydiales bacterium 38-26]
MVQEIKNSPSPSSFPEFVKNTISKPISKAWNQLSEKLDKKVDQLMTSIAFGQQFKQLERQTHRLDQRKVDIYKQTQERSSNDDVLINQKKTELAQLKEKINLETDPEEKDVLLNNQRTLEKLIVKMGGSLSLDQSEPEAILKKEIDEIDQQLHRVQEKKTVLDEHVSKLTSSDKKKLMLQKIINKVMIVRTLIMQKIIYPASDSKTNRQQVDQIQNQHPIEEAVKNQTAKKIQFFSEDHQLIDGCLIYPDKQHMDDRPVMVMVHGNDSIYEQHYALAKQYAEELNVNVLMFNPRSLGSSLGKMENSSDGVKDTKAAIQYALNNLSGNPARVGVFSHSLGGGFSAAALKEIHEENGIKIGLYANVHSFTSMSDYAGGVARDKIQEWTSGAKGIDRSEEKKAKFKTLSRGISKMVQGFLKMIHMNNLNSKRALTTTPIAHQIHVITAKKDESMLFQARLGDSLGHVEAINKIAHEEFTHNDIDYLGTDHLYKNNLKSWAQAVSA